MAVIAGKVPDVIRCKGEAIKFGVPIDVLDGTHVILYGTDEKCSQVLAASDGVITGRKNMVRRSGR